jgi:hypothetical protein
MVVVVAADDTVIVFDRHRDRKRNGRGGGLFTISEVGDACGLPGPVIMQLVPRTWTADGWMYTRDQMRTAIEIAADLRRDRGE